MSRGGVAPPAVRGTAAQGPPTLSGGVRAVAGAALVAAGVLHAVVVGPHYVDDELAGVFFVVVQVGQLGAGIAVLAAGGRTAARGLRLGGLLCAAILVVYVLSRTIGLPVGPDEPPTIGVVDVVAALLELLVVGAALGAEAAARRGRRPAPTTDRAGTAAVVGVVLVLTGYAIAVDRTHGVGSGVAGLADTDGPIGDPPGSVQVDAGVDLAAVTATFDARVPFEPSTLELPSGVDAVIRFRNDDAELRHNVSMYEPDSRGTPHFVGRIIGPGEAVDLPFRTPGPGSYVLRCDLHPWMQAQLTVGGAR